MSAPCDVGEPTNDAIGFWADSFSIVFPHFFSIGEISRPQKQVVVHVSSKTISPKYESNSFKAFFEHKWGIHALHRRNLLRRELVEAPGIAFRAICRYLRRHVLPKARILELAPRWHFSQRDLSTYIAPPALVKAYVFFQRYGGKNYLLWEFGRLTGHLPEPKPVSPFAREWVNASGPYPLQYPEGARWLHERAEADYLWTSWKRCVLLALARDAGDLDGFVDEPRVHNSITHWSACHKDGHYLLRIEAVPYPSVAAQPRRSVSKEARGKQLQEAAVDKFKKIIQELPPIAWYRLDSGDWASGAGTVPVYRPTGKWFKKKQLYLASRAKVYYVMFPKDGQYIARAFETAVEVAAPTSAEALFLLKANVERALALVPD